MSSEIKVRIRLLRKPDVEGGFTYTFNGYTACIVGGRYYVYDTVATEPEIEAKIASIEGKLLNMLLTEEYTPEEIIMMIEEKYRYIIERQYYGYGLLDPLLKDKDIVDIHAILGEPIQVIHRRFGRLITNIEMSLDEMQEIILRMSSSAGKVVSEATPVLSFIEPVHESRVTVVYYSDVTLRRSMTIDIRKQPETPWTALKIIDMKTATVDEMAFLWLMVKYKVPIVIVGELMSGKTTFANAILNLVPPDARVITIEDAPELRLHTPYWTRSTTREAKINPVSIFDVLKTAMRLTVDYIVVGEIRGEEAREWAQAILLGHGGITTFHAESPEAAIIRLTNPPIRVNPQALRLLSIFVKMIPLREEGREIIRRSEIYVYEGDKMHPLFSYNPNEDSIEMRGDPFRFKFFERIVMAHGVTIEDLKKEYKAMRRILEEVYREAKEKDAGLEKPDYKELPKMLYERLAEGLRAEVL